MDGCVRGLEVPFLGEEFGHLFVGRDSGLGNAIHAMMNLNVYMVVVNKFAWVVFMDNCVRNQADGGFELLIIVWVLHESTNLYFFNFHADRTSACSRVTDEVNANGHAGAVGFLFSIDVWSK